MVGVIISVFPILSPISLGAFSIFKNSPCCDKGRSPYPIPNLNVWLYSGSSSLITASTLSHTCSIAALAILSDITALARSEACITLNILSIPSEIVTAISAALLQPLRCSLIEFPFNVTEVPSSLTPSSTCVTSTTLYTYLGTAAFKTSASHSSIRLFIVSSAPIPLYPKYLNTSALFILLNVTCFFIYLFFLALSLCLPFPLPLPLDWLAFSTLTRRPLICTLSFIALRIFSACIAGTSTNV